ncbi:MAG: efflux RND transporter periplasmic adaptor subunit [Gemmataceae bacterium]
MHLPNQLPASPTILVRLRSLLLALVLMGIGAGLCYGTLRSTGGLFHPEPSPSDRAKSTSEPEPPAVVKMPPERWASAGIRLAKPGYSPFHQAVWRSGRLALDEARIAHIAPPIEGLVREVKVRLGQDVKAGDVLAIVDSREVGQAKLDLVKTRLATTFARAQHTWTQGTSRTALEMVKAMISGARIADIEKQFRDRPIGDLRQQLMTAYSRRLQTRSHYDAVKQADAQGALPSATVVRLRADYEAAEAAFGALSEEVGFQAGQQIRSSEQKLREAETAEALSKAGLMMLGFSAKEVEDMNPLTEGARVSHYPVRAPFSGTVIEQHAVLSERVGPQHQMFQLADLSRLWLKADVPQSDLSLVKDLAGGAVTFRMSEDNRPSSGSAESLRAEVFYVGDIVDKDTRTLPLTASVANPRRQLKAGAFVEVELQQTSEPALQVPEVAIQRQGTQTFVFVHLGGEEFRRVDVKLGRTSGGIAEIVEGLEQNQQVVVAGGFILKSEMLKDLMAGD